LANSTSGSNCAGTVVDGGYNIADDGSCGFAATNSEPIGDNVNPLLDPSGLQNNGGPTETIALENTSPAIAAVPPANCTVTTDQRGDPRPAPGYTDCDIGAFEFAGVVPSPTPTATVAPTATATAMPVATATPTATATDTATATTTATPTITATPTVTVTPTPAITVNNTSDPPLPVVSSGCTGYGFCTLREAISNANSPGTDTTCGDCAVGAAGGIINFSVTGTITLTSTLPPIQNTLTIDGTGQSITVDGSTSAHGILVVTGALTLNDLTIANNNSSAGAVTNLGTLTVTNSTFSANSATGNLQGGAIDNDATLSVSNSTFSDNSGRPTAAPS